MGGIADYIKWRGDLTFAQDTFNAIDSLVLSQIAYVDFKNIIPKAGSKETITLHQAAMDFFDLYDEKELKKVKTFIKDVPFFMRQAANSRRFGEVVLSDYMDIVDDHAEKQFSAFSAALGDGTHYIAFRGTDDTLVGWKEDFNMSFIMPVPSQIEALEYVNTYAKHKRGKLRLGGHSKGGNLAVYAAAMSNAGIKKKIIEIYNNDGPGFDKAMLESKEYQEVLPFVKTILPEHSVVGMLLWHVEDYLVVKSSQIGIMQHDAMSWQVEGNCFVTCEDISPNSRVLNEALRTWIDKLSKEERAVFVDTLFDIIRASGAKTLSDVNSDIFKSANASIKMFNSLDSDTRNIMIKILRSLTVEIRKVHRSKKSKDSEVK